MRRQLWTVTCPIRLVYDQSCLLSFQYKPISFQYSWLIVEQPIRIDWVLYKHHWEFPIKKKGMLTLELRIKHVCGFLYDASESQLVRAYQKLSRNKKIYRTLMRMENCLIMTMLKNNKVHKSISAESLRVSGAHTKQVIFHSHKVIYFRHDCL